MQKSELWSVETSRMVDFFRTQQDVTQIPAGFQFSGCRIFLEQLPCRKIGALSIPQTRITFAGEERDLNTIYHRFFMRFMSAGG